ncbi:MAG: phosphoglycerate kinase [Candidatus Bipolaricaulota bacterium]
MRLRTVKDADVRGRQVLLRADYNVPLVDHQVADEARIRASLPTLHLLLDGGAKVAVCSHLGRPKGKRVPELRMAPVAKVLSDLLGCDVPKAKDCVGAPVRETMNKLEPGSVAVLENVRFHPEEETNDPAFARSMAEPFDLFVNDAFATAHRAHASTSGITHHLPSYAGLLVDREVQALSGLISNPRRPYYMLVGGKKAKDKLGVLKTLLGKVDGFLVGGGVAFTFLKAKGHNVGQSVVDDSLIDTMKELLEEAQKRETEILLPSDAVVAREVSAAASTKVAPASKIPAGWMGLDIGPKTIKRYSEVLENAGTVVWAGPMGAFEVEPFAAGTRAIAELLAGIKGFTVVGGGETGEAVANLGLGGKFGHLSTGGGATLAFLQGMSMPALEPLRAD